MGKKKKVIMYCVLFTHSFINCRHFWPEGLKSFLIIYKAKAARLRFVPASGFLYFSIVVALEVFSFVEAKNI